MKFNTCVCLQCDGECDNQRLISVITGLESRKDWLCQDCYQLGHDRDMELYIPCKDNDYEM